MQGFLIRSKPGVLNYGSAGVASLAHLATALVASMAGVIFCSTAVSSIAGGALF